jgi:predicted Zn-dependent peptidase
MIKLTYAVLLAGALLLQPVDAVAQRKGKGTTKSSTKPANPAKPEGTDNTGFAEKSIDPPNIDVRPGPLEESVFKFSKYESFVMPNGLHVYVVEDHSLPRVTFSMAVRAGEAYDPVGKEGTATITVDLLMKGAGDKSAQQIANALDGVGATLSTSTTGEITTISGAVLKKRVDVLFDVLGNMLTHPTFDEGEFKKLRDQYVASIASEQSRSMNLAQSLSRKVIYGMDHPMSRVKTKATIEANTSADCKAYFSSWIHPNIASIAVVGDVTVPEVKKLLDKHLKDWRKAETPAVNMPDIHTEKQGVYFVPRNGSVQTALLVCAAAPSVTHDDWMAMELAGGYIGSGFGSLLFTSLRETYSYTYSPLGFTTRGNRYNRTAVGAEVRSSVTDSALNVILRDVSSLSQSGPDPEAYDRRVAYEAGQYRLSYAKASNVASYLQSAWLFNQPESWVEGWVDRIEAVGPGQVADAARRYLNLFNLRIVAVGDPSVKSKLEAFGPVYEYDAEMKPIQSAPYGDAGMTADEVIDGYVKAIGGASAVSALKTVMMNGPANMKFQGQTMTGNIKRAFMLPNKEMSILDLGMMKQAQWVDGTKAWISLNDGAVTEADASETARLISEATPLPVLNWKPAGYKLQVLGKRAGLIVIEATSPAGKVERNFFDAGSLLLVKAEKEEQTDQGPLTLIEKYGNYQSIAGVMFPTSFALESPVYSITYTYTVTVNSGVAEKDFSPEPGR